MNDIAQWLIAGVLLAVATEVASIARSLKAIAEVMSNEKKVS